MDIKASSTYNSLAHSAKIYCTSAFQNKTFITKTTVIQSMSSDYIRK